MILRQSALSTKQLFCPEFCMSRDGHLVNWKMNGSSQTLSGNSMKVSLFPQLCSIHGINIIEISRQDFHVDSSDGSAFEIYK